MLGDQAEPKPKNWLGKQVLAVTLVLTSFSLIFASRSGPFDSIPPWFPALLFFIGLIMIAQFRWLILPQMAHSQFSQALHLNNCLLTSTAAAQSFSIFGLIAAIAAGQGWVALPFAAAGLLTWILLSRYSRTQIESNPG